MAATALNLAEASAALGDAAGRLCAGELSNASGQCPPAPILELRLGPLIAHAKRSEADEEVASTDEGSLSEGSCAPSSPPQTEWAYSPAAEAGAYYSGVAGGAPWAQAPVYMQPFFPAPPFGLAPMAMQQPSSSFFTTAACPGTGQAAFMPQAEAGHRLTARERLRMRGEEILNQMKVFGPQPSSRQCAPDRSLLATAMEKAICEPRKLEAPAYAAASSYAAAWEEDPWSPAKVASSVLTSAPVLTSPPLDATMPVKKRLPAFLCEDSGMWQHAHQAAW